MVNLSQVGTKVVVGRVEVEVDGVVDPVEVVVSRVKTVVTTQHLTDTNPYTDIKHLTEIDTNLNYKMITIHITFSSY
jgi:hypothetical protein